MLAIDFAWMGSFILIGILLFLLHNIFGLNLFSKHDNKVIDKFLDKYPNVSELFINKTAKEQNIENNQEIHEINKRLAEIEKRLGNE